MNKAFTKITGSQFFNSGLTNVTGEDCYAIAVVRAMLSTSIGDILQTECPSPITAELRKIFLCEHTNCTSLLSKLGMATVHDLLPGMGDDSNRFIDAVGERLIIENTIPKEKITFMLLVRSTTMRLSDDGNHNIDMRILKCLRRSDFGVATRMHQQRF